MIVVVRDDINFMKQGQGFSSPLFSEGSQSPASLIYDQVYRNASCKQKYSTDPKYSYYNALLDMKHRLSQEQTPVYNNLFTQVRPNKTRSQHHSPLQQKKNNLPLYHVQKINKMKYKVYKQGGAQQFVRQLPVTQLSFQIKMHQQQQMKLQSTVKPRLEEILSEYRRMGHQKKRQGSVKEGRKNKREDKIEDLLNRTTQRLGSVGGGNKQ